MLAVNYPLPPLYARDAAKSCLEAGQRKKPLASTGCAMTLRAQEKVQRIAELSMWLRRAFPCVERTGRSGRNVVLRKAQRHIRKDKSRKLLGGGWGCSFLQHKRDRGPTNFGFINRGRGPASRHGEFPAHGNSTRLEASTKSSVKRASRCTTGYRAR